MFVYVCVGSDTWRKIRNEIELVYWREEYMGISITAPRLYRQLCHGSKCMQEDSDNDRKVAIIIIANTYYSFVCQTLC